MKCDYPLRVQLGPDRVVHAATEQKLSAYTTHQFGGRTFESPARTIIRTACSYKELSKKDLVENTTPITCKNCAKAIGMAEPKRSPKRFVVMRNDTGDFYKKAGWCAKWVEDPTEATLYKIRGAAEKIATRRHYFDALGKEISYHEYLKQSREGKKASMKRIKHPNYEIKTMTVTLD
jgi:hypothetical protein